MATRAEHVLLAILDAQPVDVDQIREAIDELRQRPPEQPTDAAHVAADLENLRAVAANLVLANDAWCASFKDDSIDMDGSYDRVQDAIAALRVMVGL